MRLHNRRDFLQNSAIAIGGAAATIAANTSLIGRAVLGRGSPTFHMLALGDSVMWGQGLRQKNKFTYLVKDWLENVKRVGNVDLKVFAHSGATIYEDAKFDADSKFESYDGEVNRSNPTIPRQVDLASAWYEEARPLPIPQSDVKLILLNGGINDMSKLKILNPWTRTRNLEKEIDTNCNERMTSLLTHTISKFPSARIVVTNYFPLVSCKTPWDTVYDVLLMALGSRKLTEFAIKLRESHISDLKGETHCSGLHPVLRKLDKLSRFWRDKSDEALCNAVISANSKYPWNETRTGITPRSNLAIPPSHKACDVVSANQRVFLARVESQSENAYGIEGSTYLWKLVRNQGGFTDCSNSSSTKHVRQLIAKAAKNLVSNDEMQNARPCSCIAAGRSNDLTCVRAGAFHPNRDGALAYFRSIIKVLDPIIT